MKAPDDPGLEKFKRIVGLEVTRRRAIPLGVIGFALMGIDDFRAWGLAAAITGFGLFLYCGWAIGELKENRDPMASIRKLMGLGE